MILVYLKPPVTDKFLIFRHNVENKISTNCESEKKGDCRNEVEFAY